MAYTIKSDIDATSIVVGGKTVGATISTTDNDNVYTANITGHVDLPIPTSSDIDYIFNQFPLSQFGALDGAAVAVSSSNFIVQFTSINPLFMSGQYFEIPVTDLDLSTVTATPGSKTFYMYVQLTLGTPNYTASLTELPENATTMFIGTVVTNATEITTLTINKVSRFDVYRPSLTQIGGGFPVSSGNPTETGSIGW